MRTLLAGSSSARPTAGWGRPQTTGTRTEDPTVMITANAHASQRRQPLLRTGGQRGFTIGEILAVLAILVILALLLLPATRSVGPAARRAMCVNNLKQIALALHMYAEEHHTLPPAYTVNAEGQPLHSWRTLILPYLEQQRLYESIDLAKPWNDPANAQAFATRVSVYGCLASTGAANTTTYLAIVGPSACFLAHDPRPVSDITDSPSSTLIVFEAGEEDAVPWMKPGDADESLVLNRGASKRQHHQNGTNAAFFDGSVRFIKSGASIATLRSAMTIAGDDNDVAETLWLAR
jgi:prepilin-type N-terminal cleavage/methylation domain-containing protein/prepilin-type processing-associated H-X9-DG protein